jgi:hypothetical protein
MQACYPSDGGEAANAGLCGHSVGGDLLYKPGGTREKYVGRYTLHGVTVDDEIYDAAELYANEVKKVAGYDARVEERVSAPTIHLELFGTCDAWYYDEATNTLYIWEFKFGFVSVDAFENWQMICYAAAILFNPNETASNAYNVVFVVVQPRDYSADGPVKVWRTTTEKMQPYFDRLRSSAADAFSTKPKIVSGDHCRYCKARHACEAARKSAFSAFEYSCEPIPVELTPEQLGRELEILERCKNAIEYRYEALKTQVETLIRKGRNVPQWQLRPKSHKQNWTVSAEDLEQIEKTYNTKLTKTVAITPKQAIKAGIPQDVVSMLTETKPGRNYLTHYDVRKESERFRNNGN